MQLYIRQRMFSWTDSYDVFDETGAAKYEVRAEFFTLGHQIHVYEKKTGREVGSVHEKLLTFLPQFQIVIDGQVRGAVRKELSLFRPRYSVDYRDWQAEGDFMGWDYRVHRGSTEVLSISKEIFHFTDTYVLEFQNPANEISGLLLVLAIDAANCGNKG